MALSRVKTWIAGEVLTSSDLNGEFNNLLTNALSLISPLTGALDVDGYTLTLDAAGATQVVSSAAVSWNFTSGAKAGTPATSGSVANWSAQTFTDSNTAGSGTAAAFVAHAFKRPTLAATNANVTTTDAATVYIENAPAQGSNETLTNPLALWVDDGVSRFDGAVNMFKGADIASSGTLNLTTATGNLVHVTGTTTITAVTLGSGMMRQVIFDGILTLTHHATNNNLPGGVNITTAAGDRALYWSDGTTVYCVSYQPVVGNARAGINSDITALTALTSGTPFRKNALINADFQVWDGSTTLAAIADGTYTAANWKYFKVGTMVHTVSQSSDVPTIAEAGRKIPYSILIDCTTADAAIAAADYAILRTFVKGYDFVHIAGVGLCHSFWHKHTKVGTYCVSYMNDGLDRTFVREYTQAVSDTWELATVLVDASPSAGTWNYTTGIGLQVTFSLACGSNFQTTAGTWQSSNYIATANQVNACDNTANNFRLAGVQLEKGSVATEFDVTPLVITERLCQELFEKSYSPGVDPGTVTRLGDWSGTYGSGIGGVSGPRFTVPKRIIPTMIGYSPITGASGKGYDTTATDQNITFGGIGKNGVEVVSLAGGTAGYLYHWTADARY